MPAPTHLIVVSPLDKLTAVQVKWGFVCTAPLYTVADTPPRPETHRARSGSASASQLAMAQAHLTSPDPDLLGVRVAVWVRDQPSPYAALLAGDPENGIEALTQEQSPME